MTYQLFAARDGDVVHRYLPTDDRETAEGLAAAVIADAFALTPDRFDEIVAETDGYHLEPVEAFDVRPIVTPPA